MVRNYSLFGVCCLLSICRLRSVLGMQTKAQNYYLLYQKLLQRQEPLEQEVKALRRSARPPETHRLTATHEERQTRKAPHRQRQTHKQSHTETAINLHTQTHTHTRVNIHIHAYTHRHTSYLRCVIVSCSLSSLISLKRSVSPRCSVPRRVSSLRCVRLHTFLRCGRRAREWPSAAARECSCGGASRGVEGHAGQGCEETREEAPGSGDSELSLRHAGRLWGMRGVCLYGMGGSLIASEMSLSDAGCL